MTDDQKIIELAKLDGKCTHDPANWYYLRSYDSIIPLVQKQDRDTIRIVDTILFNANMLVIEYSPAQIADALLKAKGFQV